MLSMKKKKEYPKKGPKIEGHLLCVLYKTHTAKSALRLKQHIHIWKVADLVNCHLT